MHGQRNSVALCSFVRTRCIGACNFGFKNNAVTRRALERKDDVIGQGLPGPRRCNNISALLIVVVGGRLPGGVELWSFGTATG